MNKKILVLWIIVSLIGIYLFVPTCLGLEEEYQSFPVVWKIKMPEAGVLNLTGYGSTYLSFSWDNDKYNTSEVNIWIDGEFVTKTALENYTMSDLNPSEQHKFVLTNPTNNETVFGSVTARSYISPFLYYILFGFGLLFLPLTLVNKDELSSIIFGSITFTSCFYMAHLSFPYHMSSLVWIGVTLGVVALVWVLLQTFFLVVKA